MKSPNLHVHHWCVCVLASLGSVAIAGAQTPTISASALGQTLGSTTVTEVVQFTNLGTAAATSVTITGVTSRVTLGTGTVTLASPSLPIQVGGLGIGSSAPVSFVLNTPATVKRFTLAETGTAQDAAGHTYQFSLSQLVNVNFPTITLNPSTLTFSAQTVGTSSYGGYVNITNTGSLPVSFGSIVASGDFSVTNQCGTSLAVGNSCSLYVFFAPTAAGTRTGTLTINDTAAGFPHLLPLTGTGQIAAPALTISPTSLTFPAQRLNSTQSQSITIYNSGNGPATFSSIAISGANASDFSITNNGCGTTSQAGNYCYVSIGFTPSANGVRTASVTVTDNAAGSPQTVALTGTGQTIASLSITPATVTFASQGLNTTSSSQYVYLSNSGTVPINFSSFALSGANAGDFAISANNCGTTLALYSYPYQCSVAIAFTPTATGNRTAALTITDNATGSPQSISLSGTGQPPTKTILVSPSPLTFAAQMIGTVSTQQAVTVKNTGSSTVTLASATISGANAGDFSIASNNCATPINVNLSCSVALTFAPSAAGTRTAAITLIDDAGDSPQTVALSGGGQTPTTLTFSPAGFSFPASTIGVAVYQDITVTNGGSTAAQFSYFSVSASYPSEFAIAGNTCPAYPATFGAGATCKVTISFTPARGGQRAGTLTVYDNAANSPQILFLGGNGASQSPTLAFQSILVAFNNQPVGSVSSQSYFYVTNTGNTAVNLSSIAISGANAGDFAIISNSCVGGTNNVLTPGNSCSISLTFLPTASGPRAAALTFTDNAAGSPQSVPLTGNGVALTAGASVSQTELIFGTATVGTSSFGNYNANYTYLTNTGTTPLNVSSISIGGANPSDFVITQNQCSINSNNIVPVGSSCSVSVSFTPTSTGPRSANLTFTDNAPSSPQSVTLSGVGQGPTEILSTSLGVLLFGTQPVGASTGYVQGVSVQNQGTAAVTLGAMTLSGPNAGDFSIFEANGCTNGSIPAGSSCYVGLLFAASGAGNRSAILNIPSDAPGSPLTIAVSGIGVGTDLAFSLTPTSLNFSAPLGATATSQTITILNTGASALAISSVAIAGPADYTITSNSCPSNTLFTLGSGFYCTIQIAYTPSAIGATTASLGIVTSAGNQAVLLSGAGQSPSKALLVPLQVQFANPQGVGITSLAQAVTIQNTGNEPVNLSGFAISGTNAGDFSIASNACPTSLAPSLSCTLGITFTPLATGARSASLVIADDASGSPQGIPLSGTGSIIQKTLSIVSTVDFGGVSLSSTNITSYVLANTGNSSVYLSGFSLGGTNPGDFAIRAPVLASDCVIPGSIAPGSSCSVEPGFTPTALGARSATVTYTDDASGNPHTVNFIGVGQTLNIALSIPSSLSFSATNVGAYSAAKFVLITSVGDNVAYLGGFSINGANAADFAIVQNLCLTNVSLLPGANCGISIAFRPSASGLRTATLQIVDNAAGGPHSVLLQGAGTTLTTGVALSPTTLDLGVTTVGSSSSYAQTVYLRATGNGSVTFTNLAVAGANASDFKISYNYCSGTVLTGGGQCYLGVTFTPTAAGVRSAALVVTDNADGGGTQSLPLTGLGQAATQTLLVSPGAYTFGVVSVDSVSNSASINVTNIGTSAVTFNSYAISGPNASDFSIATNSCVTTYPTNNLLQAGSACGLLITFAPSATGTRTATLTLTDNANGGTQSVVLAGIGQTGKTSIQVSPGTLAFTSPVGMATNIKYANFSNTGNTAITFSGASLTGPNAADFTISYNNCASFTTSGNGLAAGSQCSISIGFTPSAVGVETATLSVNDSTSATPQTVNLIGQGQSLQKALTVSTDLLSLGVVKIGASTSSYSSYVSLTPAGNAAVTLSSISVSGANASDFTISGCPAGTIIQYGCSVNVQFTPSAPGLRTAAIQLTDDASGTTQTIALIGSGYVSGAPVIPGTANFPSIAVGASPSVNFLNFTNNSSSAVMISAPTLVGANAGDFAIIGTTCAGTLAAQGACSVTVSFTPSAAGARVGAVEIAFAGSGGFPADAPVAGDGIGGAGYLALGVSGLEFDSTAVNTVATNQAVTLRNIGQGAITFGAVTITGANAADFSVSYTYCSNTLAPYATCSITIQFIPSGAGLRTASLQIANDAPNSPQTVSLIGIGQAATEVLSANAATMNFGSAPVGGNTTSGVSVNSTGTANVTLTGVQVTGANAGDFAITYTSCPSFLYYNCSINLKFAPSDLGIRTATLIISSDAPGSPLVVPLSGLGLAPAAAVTLSATNLDLGVVSINGQSGSSFYINNVGTSTVNFTLPSITGANAGDFTITNNGCGTTLAASSGCSFNIAFAPSAVGPRTATLQINDDAPGSPQTVTLAGTGQVVSKLLSAFANVVNFGVQDTNVASSVISIPFVASGTDVVTISGITITGAAAADFQLYSINSCTSIYGGGYCYINIQFTPSLVGAESATLTVTSDSAGGPILVTLAGAGQTGTKSLISNADNLDLGVAVVGTANSKAISLTNIGTDALALLPLSLSGPNAANFAISPTSSCSSSLAAGGTCSVLITFTPSATGTATATLNVLSNAKNSPMAIGLAGTGTLNH